MAVYRRTIYGRIDAEEAINLVSSFTRRAQSLSRGRLVITGDWNFPSRNVATRSMRDSLDAEMSAHGLSQHVTGPTHVQGGILDLFHAPSVFVQSAGVTDGEITSDHFPIMLVLNARESAPEVVPPKKLCFSSDALKADDVRRRLSHMTWPSVEESTCSDEIWNIAYLSIVALLLTSCPIKLIGYVPKPKPPILVLDELTLRAKKERQYWLQLSKRSAVANGQVLRLAILAEIRRLNKIVKIGVKRAKLLAEIRHAETVLVNRNAFWAATRKVRAGNRDGIITKFSVDGQKSAETPIEVCKLLAKKFEAHHVACASHCNGMVDVDRSRTCDSEFLDRAIFNFGLSPSNLKEIFKKLPAKKSGGPFLINYRVLKMIGPCLSEKLSFTARRIFENKSQPSSAKVQIISPIPKGSADYRPISLYCPLSKSALEGPVVEHLTEHLKRKGVIRKPQYAFSKGLNTTDALLKLLKVVSDAHAAKDRQVCVAFLDCKKAFDQVSHDAMIKAASKAEVRGYTLAYLEDFLRGRTSAVNNGGFFSDSFTVESGIPQGSKLGPVLFIMTVNDVADIPQNSEAILFADDTQTVGAANTPIDIELFNADVAGVVSGLADCGLHTNVSKCATMAIRTGPSETLPINLVINGKAVPQVSKYKSLGIMLDDEMCMDAQLKKVTQSARFAQMSINCLLAPTVQSAPARTLLFEAHVKSRVAYGNETYVPHTSKAAELLERIQRAFTRSLFPDGGLSYEERLQELGWLTTARTFDVDLICFMYKKHLRGEYDLFPMQPDTRRGRSTGELLFARPVVHGEKFKLLPAYRGPMLFMSLPTGLKRLALVGKTAPKTFRKKVIEHFQQIDAPMYSVTLKIVPQRGHFRLHCR